MSVYFVLLANCTAHDKVLDESRQTQSPEVAFEDDFSVLHLAWVGMSIDSNTHRGVQWACEANLEVSVEVFLEAMPAR